MVILFKVDYLAGVWLKCIMCEWHIESVGLYVCYTLALTQTNGFESFTRSLVLFPQLLTTDNWNMRARAHTLEDTNTHTHRQSETHTYYMFPKYSCFAALEECEVDGKLSKSTVMLLLVVMHCRDSPIFDQYNTD